MADTNKNTDNTGAWLLGLGAAALGLLGVGLAVDAATLPPEEKERRIRERRARDEARRIRLEAERREREARDEARRQEMHNAEVTTFERPQRQDPFVDLMDALVGVPRPRPHHRTVAIYTSMSMYGSPAKVIDITGPTKVGELRLIPTADGVEVRWFGTFGPESTEIESGDHEWLMRPRLTIAVL